MSIGYIRLFMKTVVADTTYEASVSHIYKQMIDPIIITDFHLYLYFI